MAAMKYPGGTSILVARLKAWWPDVYMALIAAGAMVLCLFGPDRALEAIALGKLLPLWAVSAYAWLLLWLSALYVAAVVTRRYEMVSWCALGLSVAIAVNGAITTAANGWGAIVAAAMYGIVAVSFFDRSRILRSPIPQPPPLRRNGR